MAHISERTSQPMLTPILFLTPDKTGVNCGTSSPKTGSTSTSQVLQTFPPSTGSRIASAWPIWNYLHRTNSRELGEARRIKLRRKATYIRLDIVQTRVTNRRLMPNTRGWIPFDELASIEVLIGQYKKGRKHINRKEKEKYPWPKTEDKTETRNKSVITLNYDK